MAQLNLQTRMRIAFKLLKDGNMSATFAYDPGGADFLNDTFGFKLADALWATQGPGPDDAVDIENPTPTELLTFWRKSLVEFHRRALQDSRVPAVTNAARIAEIDAVNTEIDTGLN